MEPGKPERVDHEYIRHGTKSLIAALLIHHGEVMGKCYDRHRHQEFLDFLEIIEDHFPNKELHLIIELCFSILSRKLLRRGIFNSKKELVDSIMKFIKQYNKEEKPFRWTYTGEPLRKNNI